MLGCRAPYSPTRGENGPALPKSHRAPPRNVGPADPTDLAVGTAAWLRHQPAHPREFRRNPPGGYGLALPRPASPRAPKMDLRGLEGFRKQAARARLPPHR